LRARFFSRIITFSFGLVVSRARKLCVRAR